MILTMNLEISNDTNLSTWPLHSFSAFNMEWGNMLFTLLLLVDVLVWDRIPSTLVQISEYSTTSK
jgi:hypothetical protein